MGRAISKIAGLDAHHRVIFALFVSVVAAIALRSHPLWTLLLASYDAFAFVSLVLIWLTIASIPAERIRAVAKQQDLSAKLIFVFVVMAASAAMVAVAFLLRSGRSDRSGHFATHLALAAGSVSLSWLLMHSVFALRYAHTFYGDSEATTATHAGGLQFPGQEVWPDYTDFAYFSFVIGMTCQVSDVQITSSTLRKLALAHGILSFVFNTIILALSLNIAAGLL